MDQGQHRLIDELEAVIDGKNIGDRATILRRIADLFAVASGRLSNDQVDLFDDVMGRLIDEIETSARAAFGQRLAEMPDAPPKVLRMMALDESIDVAGPILVLSDRLDDATLVTGAKTKSQAHLLAIARRKTLAECVTDVLVERGHQEVVRVAVENPGAQFSDFGYSTLVRRSANDDALAGGLWMRADVPRQHLLKLFAHASETVRAALTKRDPRKAILIMDTVAQATDRIRTESREASAEYAAAKARVEALHASGRLAETQLVEFAGAGQFDETAVALSILSALPISLIERAMTDESSEQVIVIAKAIGLGWPTVKAILLLQPGGLNDARHRLDRHFETFTRLRADTAKKAIQFYRLREKAAAARPATGSA